MKKDVNLTISVDTAADLQTVLAQCEARGLKSGRALRHVSIITGAIEEGSESTLQEIPGVVGVERERTLRPLDGNQPT